MFRMYWALSGTSTFKACSTERIDEMACTVVQTPQKRWANDQASCGSRPLRMVSIPRHIWADDQALVTVPPSTSTSILRCPSMRVIGSNVILAMYCLQVDVFYVGARHASPKGDPWVAPTHSLFRLLLRRRSSVHARHPRPPAAAPGISSPAPGSRGSRMK